jgi:hypothetical protein
MKLKDFRNFAEGTALHATKQVLPVHIQEQVALRKFLCAPCLKKGSCSVCHCSTPQMFYAPSKVDSLGRWAQFLNAKQWEALKTHIDLYSQFIHSLPTTQQFIHSPTHEPTSISDD